MSYGIDSGQLYGGTGGIDQSALNPTPMANQTTGLYGGYGAGSNLFSNQFTGFGGGLTSGGGTGMYGGGFYGGNFAGGNPTAAINNPAQVAAEGDIGQQLAGAGEVPAGQQPAAPQQDQGQSPLLQSIAARLNPVAPAAAAEIGPPGGFSSQAEQANYQQGINALKAGAGQPFGPGIANPYQGGQSFSDRFSPPPGAPTAAQAAAQVQPATATYPAAQLTPEQAATAATGFPQVAQPAAANAPAQQTGQTAADVTNQTSTGSTSSSEDPTARQQESRLNRRQQSPLQQLIQQLTRALGGGGRLSPQAAMMAMALMGGRGGRGFPFRGGGPFGGRGRAPFGRFGGRGMYGPGGQLRRPFARPWPGDGQFGGSPYGGQLGSILNQLFRGSAGDGEQPDTAGPAGPETLTDLPGGGQTGTGGQGGGGGAAPGAGATPVTPGTATPAAPAAPATAGPFRAPAGYAPRAAGPGQAVADPNAPGWPINPATGQPIAPGQQMPGPQTPQQQGARFPGTGIRANVANALAGAGLSDNAIAGMMANIASESAWRPWETGDRGASHGLFQMQGDKWRDYNRFLGGRASSPQLQAQFVAQWMRQNAPDAWRSMNNARSPGQAAQIFLRAFEKPAWVYQLQRNAQYGRGVGTVQQQIGQGG